ncbi:MAG: DUF2834 domain-containing protein [Acidobacteria bacterium]|nr:DUF2834 domain-containing protein [Acidobacteriota bacterium]
MTKTILCTVLAGFLLLSGVVVSQHGYWGFYGWALHNSATKLLFIDLVLSLALIGVWIAADAKESKINAVPYLLLTLALGVAGPLLYLLRRRPNEQMD